MKKPTALIIAVLLICVSCITVFAETIEQKGASITTTVPSTCEVTFIGVGGTVEENGVAMHERETFERKSVHTFHIIPDEDKAIDRVFFGDTDVTEQLSGGSFTTPPLTVNTVFKVTYKDAKKPDDTSSTTSSESVSSTTSSESVSSTTSSESVSSTTSSESVSSTTSSENVSSTTSSESVSSTTSSKAVSSTTSSKVTSSTTSKTSPKTGDRGTASTGGITPASVFSLSVILVFIFMFAASKKKKRED